MEIIIDRDSVCMGDDFGHQLTIECSEDETIESIMDKILQTNFFPVENLKNIAEKWDAIVNKETIFTYIPINNSIEYIIDKNSSVINLNIRYIYFKLKQRLFTLEKPNKKDYFLLTLFICLFCFNIAIITIPIFYFFSLRNNTFDTCLDTGYCKSGIEINTEYGKIKINKQNCLKYKWKWYEEDKACFISYIAIFDFWI